MYKRQVHTRWLPSSLWAVKRSLVVSVSVRWRFGRWRLTAVSYTHLDVYKRQVQYRMGDDSGATYADIFEPEVSIRYGTYMLHRCV